MDIKLDWEVESEGGWSEIGEDPAEMAARRRRGRRLRTVALGVLLIAAIAAGVAAWRLNQAARQLRTDLEATVAAETAALRLGDREGFLTAQADVGLWQRIQGGTFNSYQGLGQRIDVTGNVVEMDISANQARVTLEERLDGRLYHVVWFYERRSGLWQHMPPQAEFWGDAQSLRTTHFEFAYYSQDQKLVDILSLRMNAWWEAACRMTACVDFPASVKVRVEVDPLATPGWADYSDWTLIVPSPLLGRVPADGSPDPVILTRLAGLLAERWASDTIARHLPGTLPPYSDAAWMQEELTLWLHHAFDNAAPGSAFLGPLEAQAGPAAVPALLSQLPAVQTDQSIIPALEAAAGESVGLAAVSWDSYLAQRLRAETALVAAGHTTEATLLYRDPERQPSALVIDTPVETFAEPSSIRVAGIEELGGLSWAEVHFRLPGDRERGELAAFEPFRISGGRWVHTWPQPEDWGALVEERSPHITLVFYELDRAAVEGLLPYLEQIYLQAASDLGIAPDRVPSAQVEIAPSAGLAGSVSLDAGRPRTIDQSGGAGDARVQIPSPHVAVRQADEALIHYARLAGARGLVEELIAVQAQPFPPGHPIVFALARWEVQQLGLDYPPLPSGAINPERLPPQTLDQLWTAEANNAAHYAAAQVLLDLLVQEYGAEAVPALLANLGDSPDAATWLAVSLGISDPGDLQARWSAAVQIAVSEMP